ncbi:MAG: TonB-dependent receptor [Cruoricaptor ignavus]|nr:TonB-dependent receptor [Cruoricaptor ignavus]
MNLISKSFGLASMVCTSVFVLAQQTTGSIQGKIKNEKDASFPDVEVVAQEQKTKKNYATISDKDGRYKLEDIPSGDYILTAKNGNKTFTANKFTLLEGETYFLDVMLGEKSRLKSIEEITITGQRMSNKRAIETKRENVNIVDAISADEVGSLPDDNVGDVLKRIPGISQQDDQGETRFVSVRGLNPDYNLFTVNGSVIASPDRDKRRIFLDVLPSSLSKEMQAVKSFTANLDGGGVGAHINLVPRSAFDYKRRKHIKAFVRTGGYDNFNGPEGAMPSTKADLVYSWRPKNNDKLGVLIAADYYKRFSYTDHLQNTGRIIYFDKQNNAELVPQFTADGRQLRATGGNFYDFNSSEVYAMPEAIDRYTYLNNRTRIGITGVLDYKFNKNSALKFLSFFNQGTDDETRYGNRLLAPVVASAKYATPTSGFMNYEHRLELGAFDFNRQIWGNQLQFTHKTGQNSSLNFQSSYSGAMFHNVENFFRFTTTQLSNNSAYKLPYYINIKNRNAFYLPLDQELHSDMSIYVMRGGAQFESARKLNENVFENQLDFQNNINKKGWGYQFGLKHRYLERDYDEDNRMFTPLSRFSATDYLGKPYNMPIIGTGPDNTLISLSKYKLMNHLKPLREDTNLFSENDRTQQNNQLDYGVIERNYAAYAMGTYKSHHFYINAGVRLEHTSFNGYGRQRIDNDPNRWEDSSNNGEYTYVLPSANMHYDISEKFKMRGAFSRSMGRPYFRAFAPRGESIYMVESDGLSELRGSRGNPDLKPRISDNFDVSLEYYMGKNREIISIGLFHKIVRGEFFQVTERKDMIFEGQTLPALISQYNNLENNVILNGIEFNIVKDFTFLPGIWRGFGASFNALIMIKPKVLVPNTSGELDANGRNVLQPYTQLDGLLEQSNEVYNASLYFERKKIKARLAYHYTGPFIHFLNTSLPERNRTMLGREIVDFRFQYQLNKSVGLSLLAQNLTNSGPRTNFNVPGAENQYALMVKRNFGRAYFVGTTIQF